VSWTYRFRRRQFLYPCGVYGSGEQPVKLSMPFTLKKQLVDDWTMVCR
jgi:hypothetical protein